MAILMPFVLTVHLIATVIWVGGMFLAYRVLRPASLVLEPPARLNLWLGVFERFFAWVWLAIALIILSGYLDWMWRFGSLESMPLYLHLMQGIGWVMVALFGWMYFKAFKPFQQAVAAQNFPLAGQLLNSKIRPVIAINLSLGFVEIIIGSVGRYF
ncbi:MAG: CopD family protein [Thiomicrospira sp.]|jgi:uncharacterized membrane protein|nr:CopD family protein [Thiomicrospira sp.]